MGKMFDWLRGKAAEAHREEQHLPTTMNVETEMATSEAISAPLTREPGHCPQCGSNLWKPMATSWRCGQCGHQSDCQQAIGASRADSSVA
jgi:ribosomal protein L37AE/L43A